jgi:ribose transport system ATP-binding protein
MTEQPGAQVLQMKRISKGFPGVRALDAVDFDLKAGEVHAIVGENGAGKSTLIKILSGAYLPDSGHIIVRGRPVSNLTPHSAQQLGIATIYQERNLVPLMTVGENILLNHEPRNAGGFVDMRRLYREAQEILTGLDIDLDAHVVVSTLGAARQQAVELAKALFLKASIVVMDEPTAAFDQSEIRNLFAMARRLRSQGTSVVYISHHLEEVFQIADRVTVLRDGCRIGTYGIGDVTEKSLVSLMVGREIANIQVGMSSVTTEEVLRLEHVSAAGVLSDINLRLHRGEILGVAGMVGSGRTELARLLFGALQPSGGRIFFKGREVRSQTPARSIQGGIGLVPEERKIDGLVLGMDVAKNITLAALRRFRSILLLDLGREKRSAQEYMERLGIRATGAAQQVQFLSGGNQQKVVMAKWLLADADLLIVDEPTKGVDVAAKAEIHHLMRELCERGKAILMISSDLPEIITMSHRIAVMRKGRIVTELPCEGVTQELVLAHAIGGEGNGNQK